MIKVEVIEKFTLKDFDELKNIERRGVDEKGTLFVGDTFECNKDMVDYLTGKNPLNKAVVKVVEVVPEKEVAVLLDEEKVHIIPVQEEKKEEKPKKKKKK